MHRRNCGRDPFPLLLSRRKLPKTVPPVFGRPLSPASQHRLGVEYYTWQDLAIGSTVQVYGRNLFIYDCDGSTREWYKEKLQMREVDLAPIKVGTSESTHTHTHTYTHTGSSHTHITHAHLTQTAFITYSLMAHGVMPIALPPACRLTLTCWFSAPSCPSCPMSSPSAQRRTACRTCCIWSPSPPHTHTTTSWTTGTRCCGSMQAWWPLGATTC